MSLLSSFSSLVRRATTSSPLSLSAAPLTRTQSLFRIQPSLPSASRARGDLAPRRTKYKKAHKGRVPLPTGGSTKGTSLAFGDFGLRIAGDVSARISAKQLKSADAALRKKLKVIKGTQIWMRVFPDIPVCVKGNETRMGKGKGSFEFWACRAPPGRVLFEIGGEGLREEIARDALKIVSAVLPVRTDFITRATPPRVGMLLVPPKPATPTTSTTSTTSTIPPPSSTLDQTAASL
ncbi:ribosomal protein L16 [Clavulina sp. PMI_390]|nr:ribosomal protein L16 [Clavulina sp. PMI_390]